MGDGGQGSGRVVVQHVALFHPRPREPVVGAGSDKTPVCEHESLNLVVHLHRLAVPPENEPVEFHVWRRVGERLNPRRVELRYGHAERPAPPEHVEVGSVEGRRAGRHEQRRRDVGRVKRKRQVPRRAVEVRSGE